MTRPLRLAYFGSGNFAVAPLEAILHRHDLFEVVAVVCQPDRPVGRKGLLEACPIGQLPSDNREYRLFKPERVKGDEGFATELKKLDLDLAIVACYGQILPSELLKIPKLGFLNLHGSILPAWRGASPIQQALRAGESKTGISLMLMDEKMDHGPIISVVDLEIAPNDTCQSLERRLSRLAADMAINDIPKYAAGSLQPIEQDHTQATLCRTISKNDGKIDWSAESANEIERKLRAYTPWPGIYAVWARQKKPTRIRLLRIRVDADERGLPPGTVVESKDGRPAAAASDGNLVVFLECQLEGKQACSGRAVACGYQDLIGAVLS